MGAIPASDKLTTWGLGVEICKGWNAMVEIAHPFFNACPCLLNVAGLLTIWINQIWKVKKLIKRLEAARGNGTSMISLIIRMSHLESISFRTDVSALSTQGSSIPCGENVGRGIRYCLQHQVASQSTFGLVRHYLNTTTSKVVFKSPTERLGHLLW